MSRFHLIRHGENDWLKKGLAGRIAGVSLNATGRAQAERLARRLAHVKFDRVYASPLERARETAAPLAAAQNLEIRIAPEINELDFGEWNGQPFEVLHADPRWAEWCAFRSVVRMPGGELMTEVQDRVVNFITRLHAELPDGTFALVSHGDSIRSALCYFLGMPLDFLPRIDITPASMSVISLGAGAPSVHFMSMPLD